MLKLSKCIWNLKLDKVNNFKSSCLTSLMVSSRFESIDFSKRENLSWSSGCKEKPWSKNLSPPITFEGTRTPWTKKRSFEELSGLKCHQFDPNDPLQKYPYTRADGGVQYFNFIYYPRFPGQEDLPVETPSPLFLIMRRKNMVGRPWWEKDIMRKLGFSTNGKNKWAKKNKRIVVKNIPEINGFLWQVKHLITIVPVKLPENIPDNTNPLQYFLTDGGEIKYRPGITPYTENDLVTEVLPEKQIFDYNWVDDRTRKIYKNSLNNEF